MTFFLAYRREGNIPEVEIKFLQIDPMCWLTHPGCAHLVNEVFVVKNRVLVLVTLLPFAALGSNYHPPGITVLMTILVLCGLRFDNI